LSVREIRVVLGDFHRLTELRLNWERLPPSAKASHIFSYFVIFQTGSKKLAG
jgi:hypothetical protein